MNKKLPGVYANKIDKELENNKKVFYSNLNNNDSLNEVNNNTLKDKDKSLNLNINQKINNIFNSSKYVYKADVEIITKESKLVKKIIGQNKTHLITMENELIPISEIIDINFVN